MKLIVGLGNPGREYEKTRHNVGFMALDEILNYWNIDCKKEKFQGLYGEMFYQQEKIVFLKPQKYMNLSGEVVRAYMDFYHLNKEDILIIHDDLDLPIGKLKWRAKGSSGGHNGLKNIELHLGSDAYFRLKIGISNNKQMDTKDYVLGKFTKEEMEQLNPIFHSMVSYIEDFLSLPFSQVMNKYNRK